MELSSTLKTGSTVELESMISCCQAVAPPAGFVETSATPLAPTATQRFVEAHDTAERLAGTRKVLHEPGFVGSVEVTTSPSMSTATQNDGSTQETPLYVLFGCVGIFSHRDGSAGSVLTWIWPW